MVKKRVKKKVVSKKSVKKTSAISLDSTKGLARNFVELQKVMTIQSMKIDKLTTQISGLLDLFASSAKALAKKEFGAGNSEEISKLNDRLNDLFDQNAKMSKGIMESMAPEPMYSPSMEVQAPVSPSAKVQQGMQQQPVRVA